MVPLPNSTDKEPQESMKKANRRVEINSHRPGLTFDPCLSLSREGDVSERSSITAVSRYHLPSCSLCRYLETQEALHEVSISQDPSRRLRWAHFHRTVQHWALTPSHPLRRRGNPFVPPFLSVWHVWISFILNTFTIHAFVRTQQQTNVVFN